MKFVASLELYLSCYHPAMDKKKVAEVLEEIGVLLELRGENPFKIRAYTNAARAIRGLQANSGNRLLNPRIEIERIERGLNLGIE